MQATLRHGFTRPSYSRDRKQRPLRAWQSISDIEALVAAEGDVALDAGRGLTLDDAAGVEVRCIDGRVWLTMEGDSRDVVLARGEAYTIERNGLTLVSTADPSTLQVRRQWDAHYAGWRPWLRRFAAWIVRAGESRARRFPLSRYY
jgi:hypothetical protein